jgi:hypothetical protein
LPHPAYFYARNYLDLLYMKSRKERRKGKSRKKSPPGLLFFVIIVVSILFVYYLLFMRPPSNGMSSQPFQFKAAIVDHLSLTAPNQSFIQTATNILKNAGYTVDYYPGDEVNVEFYRNIPTHGYSLIILRVHSALRDPDKPPLVLFTSQNWSSTKYVPEQLNDRIVPVAYNPEEVKKKILYFGITPKFVEQDMKGKFVNTTIIMMGCNGLTYPEMAEAFIYKGAKVCISWDGPVSASHTDQATTQLLQHLITERQTIKQAVAEIEPDPTNGSILKYYPPIEERGSYIVPEAKSNLTANIAQKPETIKFKKRVSMRRMSTWFKKA